MNELKKDDKVVVKATGKTTTVDCVNPVFCPPIWCANGHGYFAKELKKVRPDLSASGPYASGDDRELARSFGITVKQLRSDRARDDRPSEEKSA